MLDHIHHSLRAVLSESLKDIAPDVSELPTVDLEIPSDASNGDFASNLALKSAKIFRKNPAQIAGQLAPLVEQRIRNSPELKRTIAKVEVKAGFINFFLSPQAWQSFVPEMIKQGSAYGKLTHGRGTKILVEFVSANPTGSLSVAHGRQAAVGDALANVLIAAGYEAHREFYVNDCGNQIRMLGLSLKCRALENLGETAEFPADGYQGEYVKDMAVEFMGERRITTAAQLQNVSNEDYQNYSKTYLLDVIKKELDDFGVRFDAWTFESEVADVQSLEAVVKFLKERGHIYEQDGALWFKTTAFGDDKDRVIKKSDGTYTYFMPDIVYHKNKFDRGFDRVYDLLGPDHHGYISRLKAAAQALGRKTEDLEVLIIQLVTLMSNGEVVQMSKRSGKYITLRDVMDEVGVDAARFFLLMRSRSAHLEFDLELAKKQSSENPVYYIQYAHARVYSLDQKAAEAGIRPAKDLSLLKEAEEIDLIKRMAHFSDMILIAATVLDPHPVVSYLQDLAGRFHKFYDCHRIIDASNQELSSQRLTLCHAARVVIGNGLRLLGVSTPEKM